MNIPKNLNIGLRKSYVYLIYFFKYIFPRSTNYCLNNGYTQVVPW